MTRPTRPSEAPPTTGWHLGPLAGFDIESTGPAPETALMVQTAITRRPQSLGEARPELSGDTVWLINPGVEIPPEAAAIHGITTEQAQTGMDAAKATEEIRDALCLLFSNRFPVVIFNARYDLTVLDRECRRHGLDPLELGAGALVIDPFVLDKFLDRYRPGSRKLVDQCRHYGVTIDGAHEASADALAAMRVGWRIAHTHGRIANYSAEALMHLQGSAAKDQAISLAKYFRSSGQPKPVAIDWPVIPWPEEDRRYA